ncbi:MAG TPA: TetR/AcrR family transcriptional regulator C-terminal domain-containing protein [Ardenticatenaceae bacterium]|nr:TetR/AcrR family transcriptional regulator C-terminal domain-containing protein [Ardenticatenaceae bacterium]
MASQAGQGAEPRVPLSRERVLRAAINLADESGIESLTMRKLAQVLGVEAMTLYYYVAKKDDILDGIVDLVVSEMELADGGAGWKVAIRKTAISAHEVLVRHPWAASLMMSTTGVSPARLRWMDSLLRCLREAGFSAELTHHAYHALDSHITGFTLWEVSFPFDAAELANIGVAFLRELPGDEYPYLAEHIEQHLTPSSHDDEGEFEFGLDLILDGLERLRDTS